MPRIQIKQTYSITKCKGTGKLSILKDTNYTSIINGQVREGDFIFSRANCCEIYAVADDAFYPEGVRNVVRFKSVVTKNVNKQPFDIVRCRILGH